MISVEASPFTDQDSIEAKICGVISQYFADNPNEMFFFLNVTDSGGEKQVYRITNSKLMPYAEVAQRIVNADQRKNAIKTVEIRNR